LDVEEDRGDTGEIFVGVTGVEFVGVYGLALE